MSQAPAERRGGGDRRKYNRRTTTDSVSPPYFETFERMAAALEDIRDQLAGGRTVSLPSSQERTGLGWADERLRTGPPPPRAG